MISPDAAERIRALLSQLEDVVTVELAEYRAAELPAEPAPDRPALAAGMARPADSSAFFADAGKFYDFLRANDMLGPVITTKEFTGCENTIIGFGMAGAPVSYCAYGLATKFLETNGSMEPVREAYWLTLKQAEAYARRMYDIKGARPSKARELGNLTPGDGARYMGRGDVQLTGLTNYRRATAKLRALGYDVDLVKNPERAMEPQIAAVIMVYGMIEGWFTGRKLSDDLPASGAATFKQFEDSRDIINGRDKDDVIARFAIDFQTALLRGGYRPARLAA